MFRDCITGFPLNGLIILTAEAKHNSCIIISWVLEFLEFEHDLIVWIELVIVLNFSKFVKYLFSLALLILVPLGIFKILFLKLICLYNGNTDKTKG